MRLKLLTTGAFVLGIVLILMWPWVIRQRPLAMDGIGPPRRMVAAFQVMLAGYMGASTFSFMTAGCLAMLVMRNAREEYARQALENVRELVEGSMEDLRSRNKARPDQ
ncbi:MAG TPA: hypothetical protein VKT78_05695 [Fimbriimonadaceae bacterium]|nr:hypothetical protein [Fimbriimonadaceae bacterium]